MNELCLLAAAVVTTACGATAGAAESLVGTGTTGTSPKWEAVGPEGGYFKEIAVSPRDPATVFAGSDDSGGIWKSTDGGDSWRLVTGNLRDVCGWWIEFDPNDSDIMYAADIYGRHPLLKSSDAGETWKNIGNNIPFRRTSCIAVDPKDTSIIYVGTGFGDSRPGDGIFKSTDGGSTWARAGHKGSTIYALQAHPRGGVYAGTEDGLFRSTDQAHTWERVAGGFPAVGAGVVTMTRDGTLYVGSPGPEHSLYRSTDGGQNWTGLGLPAVIVWDIAEEPDSNGNTIYVGALAGEHAIYKTTDGGKSWEPHDKGILGKWAIAMTQGPDKTLYCSNFTNKGIYRSRDGAQSWHEANRGLYATYVTGLTLDPSDPSRLIATGLGPYNADPNAIGPVTWEGRVGNNNVEWSLLNDLHVQTYSPSISPADPKVLMYGSFMKGVYFSQTGGEGVKNIHESGICTATIFDPDDPNIAIASLAELDPPKQLVLRTADRGETWQHIPVEFAARCLIAEKGSPRIWAAGGTGIVRSDDNGVTWHPRGLQGSELLTVAQHPDNPATLFAGGKKTILQISRNAGDSWDIVDHPAWPEECDVHTIIFDPADAQRIYVGLNGAEIHTKTQDHDGWRGGVWTSPDLGKTWTDITGDLNNDQVWVLVATPDGRTLYAATYAGGVYRIVDIEH